MSLSLHVTPYRVPLSSPIRTARTVISERCGWRLQLRCHQTQLTGWGEVACWPGFGSGLAETEREVSAWEQGGPLSGGPLSGGLMACALTEPSAPCTLEELQQACAHVSSLEARHGLELAALDLRARALGRPLATLLTKGSEVPRRAPTHCLIRDLEGAKRAVESGFRSLKLKVGAGAHWSEDGLLIAELSAYLDDLKGAVTLRLDANQAWSEVDAVGALVTAHAYGVEWLEEPLQRSLTESQGWSLWRSLQRRTGVTLAADESLQQAPLGEPLSASLIQRRLGQALDEGVEVITLKPMFVGGLLSCATLARTALQRGARVCLTHALEGALGRRGVAHLCAALASEGLRVEGGLTGALPVDVMSPLEVSEGQVLIPDEPGLGAVNGGER